MKDERLIQKAISGDSSAFCKLVEKYFDSVCSALCSLITDPLDAEEIAQEAFLRAYLHLRKLRRPSSFKTWVMRIAFNIAFDRMRKREPQIISLSQIDPDKLSIPSFEDEILRNELLEETEKLIDRLPEMDREMLKRWLFEGKSYGELSEEYGLSYSAVAKRVQRGLKKIRKRLKWKFGGVILMPWRKIMKFPGSVIMKLSTKAVVTGMGILIAGGFGVWIVMHKWEDEPVVKPRDMMYGKVEESVTSQKSVRKEESDDLTFEEFNAFLDAVLDEYSDEQSEQAVSLEEDIPSTPDKAWGEMKRETPQDKQDETEETVPEELRWAIERIKEVRAEEERLRKKLDELVEENNDLIELVNYYDSMGMEEKSREAFRRHFYLVKYVIDPLVDTSNRLMDERFRLFDIVERYAFQGNTVALEFLKKNPFYYKRFLKRLRGEPVDF